MEEVTAAEAQPRKLDKAERIVAVKDGGMFPVLIRLTNGTLAAVGRGGAPHLGVGGRLDLVTSPDGGRTWSAPRAIVYMPPDSRNPAFGQTADGRLICAFAVTGPYREGKYVFESTRFTVWTTTSTDDGNSWTTPQPLDVAPLQHASPYGKIVCLSDGALLMAVYGWFVSECEGGELPAEKKGWFSYVFRSKDNGITWGEPVLIAPGCNETALCVLPDNKVLAVMRKDNGEPELSQSISHDGGRTWNAAQTILRGRRRPADVIRLKSGRLLLSLGRRVPPYGTEAVLSGKELGQWDWQTNALLEWDAANTDCGYPSSVETDEGTIVTLYYGVRHLVQPDLGEYATCVRYREGDLEAAR